MQSILFDLDGTLVTTEPTYRYDVVRATLDELGRQDPIPDDLVDRFWFGSGRDRLVEEDFGVLAVTFWDSFKRIDTTEHRMARTRPFPDVSVLADLKGEDRKLGIVTGAPTHIAELEVSMLGAHLFDSIISTHSLPSGSHKPNPAGLIACLDALELRVEDVVYVGNADEDMEAASSCGMTGIYIDRGEHLLEHDWPVSRIANLTELGSLISGQTVASR